MNKKESKPKGAVKIGTSGIVVPGAKQSFPEQFQSSSRLHYYSSLFNTVEINSTFHKIPLARTFERWSAEVPDAFNFTIKLWRAITHVKKLLYKIDDIDVFMDAANHLGDKKGCLLLQFPASIGFDYCNEVEKIIKRLDELNSDGQWKLAIEVRNKSWYNEAMYDMLMKYKTSLVLQDIAASKTPMGIPVTNIVYLRFHGPNGDYRGSYTQEFLEEYAHRIKQWAGEGNEVYVYFNNTMGQAFENARLLQELVQI